MAELAAPAARFRPSLDVRSGSTTLAVIVTLGGLALADGGYFATSWAWAGLGALAVLAAGFAGDSLRFRPLAYVGIAALAGLGALTWIALLWTDNAVETTQEGQRLILYVAAPVALALLLRDRPIGIVAAGVLTAISIPATYALATRLFPDRLGVFDPVAGYRLSEPLGYWNGLGIFAAMGALLALGLSARVKTPLLRAVAAGLLAILLPTIYFTFSRGAWIALGLGYLAAVAIDPRRLQFLAATLAIVPAPAAAVLLASRADALSRTDAPLAEAVREGNRLAVYVSVAAVLAGALAAAFAIIERRIRIPPLARKVFAIALLSAVAVILVSVFARYGGPITLVEKGHEAFTKPISNDPDLRTRFTTFSGAYRAELWTEARDQFSENPVLGAGPGSYEGYWLQHRPIPHKVVDAHSLYLETLAELGVAGGLLLAIALAVPVAAAWQLRRHPLAAVLLAPLFAYLVHAAVDWDWELPAVTLAALFCATALVIGATRLPERRRPSPRARFALLVGSLVAVAFSFAGLVGSSAVGASDEAAAQERWSEAEDEARKGTRWLRWSSEPWERLAAAQAGQGERADAAASYSRAIDKEPREWTLWFGLAEVTSGHARRRALAEARQLNPRSPEIREFGRAEGDAP